MERKNTIGWNDNINNFYQNLQKYQAGEADPKGIGEWIVQGFGGNPQLGWDKSNRPDPAAFSSDEAELQVMRKLLEQLFGAGSGVPLPEDPGTAGEGRKDIMKEWTF